MQAKLSLRYFSDLMGSYGLYQHADTRKPLLSEGYCTDDNTRAVQVLVHMIPVLPDETKNTAKHLLASCWNFLKEAETFPGAYTNFRAADGTWLPRQPESEDMYARLIRCLTEVIIHDSNPERRSEAIMMLTRLESHIQKITAPRAQAEILIALCNVLQNPNSPFPSAIVQINSYVHDLCSLWSKNATSDWPWFELTMTYANALLPHALLTASFVTDVDKDIISRSANFLIKSTIREDMFVPIGSVGWYPKNGTPSQDNQQPIEAGLMFDFLLAWQQSGLIKFSEHIVAAPYLWFFGKNTKHAIMVNTDIGACYDGIFDTHINKHRGAESMLAYLWAETLRQTAPEEVKQYIAQEHSNESNSSQAV